MNFKTMILAAFIAGSYVAWPNLAKPLGLRPGLVVFVVVLVALLVVTIMSATDISSISRISGKALIALLAVSVANALAIPLYAAVAGDKNIQTGVFLITVFVLQMVFALLIDWLVNGTKLSALQWLGFALAIPAMLLLAQKSPQ